MQRGGCGNTPAPLALRPVAAVSTQCRTFRNAILAVYRQARTESGAGPQLMNAIPVMTSGGFRAAGGEDDNVDGNGGGTGVGIATKTRTRTAKPALYKVLLLNDDYTPMEFVVLTLQRFFKMSIEDATRVMLHVHQRGVGVCGIFTYEVAETKVNQVIDFAREHQHPLQCTMEKD
jgi:ATP-dependent Clp protease adaptor protein ClpS